MRKQNRIEFLTLAQRIGRVTPSFVLLSAGSCMIALAVGFPRRELAVTAAVPLIGTFLTIKALTVILPEPDEVLQKRARRRPPNAIWHIGKFAIFSTLLIVVWFFSGAMFAYLGLERQKVEAIHLAAWSGLFALVCFLLIVLIAMRTVIRSWGDVFLREIANILRYPMRIVESLPKISGVRR